MADNENQRIMNENGTNIENNNTGSRIPKLRFPGFTGEWVERQLRDSFDERTERNRGDLSLLSLGEEGLVYQSETDRKDNSNADKSKYLRVAIGDIAYNTMRMWQGRCVCAGIEGIVSPAYTVCKPKSGIDSMFHYYLFKTNRMIQLFHKNSQGLVSDTLNLKFEAFSKIGYLLPPTLSEQQKIASCLSELDNLITAQGQKVDALKEKKKGLMQQLFPQPGETVPRLRFLGFEGEWEKKLLGEVGNVCMCKRIMKHETTPTGPIPFYKIGTFGKKADAFIQEKLFFEYKKKYSYPKKGDILFSAAGTIGRCVVFDGAPAYFQDSNIVWIANDESIVYNSFLKYIYTFIDWKIDDGGIVKRLYNDSIRKTSFYTPSLLEQHKIAECLSALDDTIAAEAEKLEALKNHKKGLMQQLFPQPAK